MQSLTRAALALMLGSLAPQAPAQTDAVLADAIQAGDRAGALEALRLGADVDARQGDGTTALHWAVYKVDAELVEALLAREADPDVVNAFGSSPLAEAVKVADPRLVDLLLEAGADPDAANADGQTALMLAAHTGVVEVGELLLAAGAEVNAVETWRGQTALMWAAADARGEFAKLLVEHGADVNVRAAAFDWGSQITNEPRGQYRPSGGLTPLLYAARGGCAPCVDAILGAGADIDLPDPDGVTPLMVAIDNLHFDVAKQLLDAGADPHPWDWWGRTALYIAVDVRDFDEDVDLDGIPTNRTSSLAMIQALLDAGVDRNPQLNMHRPGRGGNGRFTDDLLNTGATPLLRAADTMDHEAAQLLLEAGALVDLPNAMGVTPLLAAAGYGGERGALAGRFSTSKEADAIATLELLVAAGADLDAKVRDTTSHTARIARRSTMSDREGQNALFGAVTQGWLEVTRWLLARGVDPTITDARGKTLIDAAMGQAGARIDKPLEPMVAFLQSLQE